MMNSKALQKIIPIVKIGKIVHFGKKKGKKIDVYENYKKI